MEKNLTEILSDIQSKLNVPKNHFNGFGKYNYRNAEDIVEAAKPLLAEHKVALIITDELIMVGDRYYIKATAVINNGENQLGAVGYAREDLIKKGMDVSQLTGSTSSYARKYALNGLFAIDDTKDADSGDNTGNGDKKPQDKKPAPEKTKPITRTYPEELVYCKAEMVKACKGNEEDALFELHEIAKTFNKEKLSEIEGFDQAKVRPAVEAKIKQIKGDK